MARPIESTPPLSGEDATKLLEALERGASKSEMRVREKRAQDAMKQLADKRGIFVDEAIAAVMIENHGVLAELADR